MVNSFINWVLTYSKIFIFVILLITTFLGLFIYKNISINTSNTDLLSKELTFRKNDIAFKKEFPQFSNNIMIVIDAEKQDIVNDIALTVYNKVKDKEEILFNDIFYPDELDFFKKNGFLYLSENNLEEKLDEMAAYQPFISRLSEEPTLYGFLNTIDLFLSADLEDVHVDRIDKLFKKITKDKGYLTWGDIFSNENKSNYRKIIYLQPKLDFSNFFPSKKSLDFIEEQIEDIKKNSNFNNFNIRLSGTVPMEQDELNTLGDGAKIGVTISLILVFIFLFYAFKNKFYLFASFLTLLIGLIWTTSFALILFKELNLISIAFAILFIGLGIDFSIHYLLRTYEFSNKKINDFLISTNKSITNALFLTAIAVAIGFFSFAFTSFKGLSQLGIIAGSGMFISLFLTLFFLPALLVFFKNFQYQEFGRYKKNIKKDFYFSSFMAFFENNNRFFFILSMTFLLFSVFNLKNIKFDNDPLKLRNQESISVVTMNELIKDNDINVDNVDVLVENISKAKELKKYFLNLEEVKEVNFFDDLIPENQDIKLEILNQFKTFFPEINLTQPRVLNKNLWEKEKEKIKELLKNIEIKINEKYKSKLDTSYVKSLKQEINTFDISNINNLENNIFYFFRKNIEKFNNSLDAKKFSKENIPVNLKSRYIGKDGKIRLEIVSSRDLSDKDNKKIFINSIFEVAPNLSGGAFITYEAGKAIVESFREAMIISICLTMLFLFFTLKNLKKVFIVFINLIAALLFALSFQNIFGFSLNFANIIALPLLFGLGAATSIQTILRIEKFGTLDDYFNNSTTPRAIIFSLLTTLGTFFVLALSSHAGTASMGKLLIISIFSIFLANLTILIPLEKFFFKK